jgi:PBSX family phage portal protein
LGYGVIRQPHEGNAVSETQIKKTEAQVFRITQPGRAVDLKKDLGPNGGNNPDGKTVQGNAFEPEDEYQQLYVGATRDQGIIMPPYPLRTLDRLSQENNALGPCIEAMVNNVEGTGYDFESKDQDEAEDEKDDTNAQKLMDFFGEPWPGTTFTAIRKLLRRDLERTGNAYLEILRNAQDEIVFFRRVDAKMMRMLRLDDAVPVDQTVTRQGKQVTIKVMTRERRYCQLVNGVSLMYFKEFGSTRDLYKKTAVWAGDGQRIPAPQRATEILHLIALPDAHTPYGVPRWINQMPSVLGSRKAEEFNLDFFDNGGVPPVLVLLQGGTLGAETRKAIEAKTTGPASKNNRFQVLEVEPSGGSLDQTPQARVTVERFGGDRTTDSMFEKYDERCEERVRRSFRIPPIFVGQSKDYNFATAFASYVVAEAQVFKPERDAFDEIITMRLLPEMKFPDYKLRSKPMVIEDATLKLQGIEVLQAMGDQIEPKDIVEAINEIVGIHLKVSDAAPDLAKKLAPPPVDPMTQLPQPIPGGTTHMVQPNGQIKPINPAPANPAKGMPKPGAPSATGGQPGSVKPRPAPAVMGGSGSSPQSPSGAKVKVGKSEMTSLSLARDLMVAMRKRDFEEMGSNMAIMLGLSIADQARVQEDAASLQFIDTSFDPEGLGHLAAATMHALAGCGHDH